MNDELAKQLAEALQHANEAVPGMAETLWAALVRGNQVEGAMAVVGLLVFGTLAVLSTRTLVRLMFRGCPEDMDYEQYGAVQVCCGVGSILAGFGAVICFTMAGAVVCPEYYAAMDLLAALGR